jgi:hypothetical protein
MQTKSKTSMARQVVFKQTSSKGKRASNNGPIKTSKQIEQSDQANKQNRKGHHLPCSWQGVETRSFQTNKRQTKAIIEYRANKINKTRSSNQQIKHTNKIAKLQCLPCSCARWFFCLKRLLLQLLAEIAKNITPRDILAS